MKQGAAVSSEDVLFAIHSGGSSHVVEPHLPPDVVEPHLLPDVQEGAVKDRQGNNRNLLTSVLGTEDNHLLVRKVEGNRGRGGHAAGIPVGRESTGIVDGVVGLEVLKLFP